MSMDKTTRSADRAANRGLQQFRVRGLEKVRTVSLWHAIVFNFMRMIDLGCVKYNNTDDNTAEPSEPNTTTK